LAFIPSSYWAWLYCSYSVKIKIWRIQIFRSKVFAKKFKIQSGTKFAPLGWPVEATQTTIIEQWRSLYFRLLSNYVLCCQYKCTAARNNSVR